MSKEFTPVDPKLAEEIGKAVAFALSHDSSKAGLSAQEMTAVSGMRAGGKTSIPVTIGYMQGGFIGTIVAPEVQASPDGNELAYYPKFNKEAFFSAGDDTIAIGGSTMTSDVEFGWDSCSLTVHGHETFADPREIRIAAANGVDLASEKYELAKAKVQLTKEINIAASLMAEANVGTHDDLTSGGTGTNWANYATNSGAYYSTPVKNIYDAEELIRLRTGVRPNTLVLSPKALKALQFHPALQALMLFAGTAKVAGQPVSLDALATIFNKRIVVGDAVKTATFNAATFTDVWAGAHNDALLCYVNPNSNIKSPTHARTLTSGGYPKTKSYEDPKRGAEGSTAYRYIDAYAPVVFMSGAAAHLFIGAGYDA